MYSDRDIEKIRENIYWEKILRELKQDEDCSDALREEIDKNIEKLQSENNMIEYGITYKPR